MTDKARRRELREQYRETRPEAGGDGVRNTRNGRVLLASTPNLPGARNRFGLGRSTAVLDVGATMTPPEIARALATPRESRRDKLASTERC